MLLHHILTLQMILQHGTLPIFLKAIVNLNLLQLVQLIYLLLLQLFLVPLLLFMVLFLLHCLILRIKCVFVQHLLTEFRQRFDFLLLCQVLVLGGDVGICGPVIGVSEGTRVVLGVNWLALGDYGLITAILH